MSSASLAMVIPTLPNELANLILIESVHVLGCMKRVCRLRLASRSWNIAVVDAIFESDILLGGRTMWGPPFGSRYLAYRILHRAKPVTHGILVVRQVAQEILTSGDAVSGTSEHALRQFVQDLCGQTAHGWGSPVWFWDMNPDFASSEWVTQTRDQYYDQILLCAAACRNNVAIAKEVLSRNQDCLWLLSQNGRDDSK